MLAARLHVLGGPLVLEQVEEPAPAGDQLLIELVAATVNPVDVATSSGRHYSGVPDVPYTGGTEAVGRAGGMLVYTARTPTGTLAERFAALPDETWELPAGTDPAIAAALGIAGLAGWLPLAERARLQPGERVLVLGATGAVGQVAVQAARLLGASFVVAAGRDRSALERTRALGADATVALDGGDLVAGLRQAFGDRGPDVVFDPLWGAPVRAALEVAARHARAVHLGQSAANDVLLSCATVRGKMLDLLGYSNRLMPREVRRAAHLTMLEHAAAGRLQVEVEPYPLTRAPEAWEAVRAGARRKPVVVPDDG